MKTDFKFLRKYWKCHKGSFLTVILSVIFLAIMLCTALLLERSELRRDLHTCYDVDGAFDYEYLNVDSDTLDFIRNNDVVEAIGEVYCVGKVKYADSSATVGAYKNKTAADLAHYSIAEGRLPENIGEIALTRDIYKAFCPFMQLGKTVTIPIYDSEGSLVDETERTLVGVMDVFPRNTFEGSMMLIGTSASYADPRILISYEEAVNFTNGYTNVMVTIHNGEEAALFNTSKYSSLEEMTDPRFKKSLEFHFEMFDRGYSNIGTGRLRGVQMISGYTDTPDDVRLSSKSKMIRFVSVFAIIITIISLFSGISTVMASRMESFKLMQCIGYSKRRIKRMLLIEALMIFAVGTAIGIIFGICIYEGIYYVQTNVFGLLPYRGYNAEWVVSQKTFSPFLTPIIAAGIGVAISYAIVILKLDRDMNITAASGKIKRRSNVNTAFGAVSRVLSQRAVGVLQIVSLVCVIFASVVSYLYCVKDGKGKTVLNNYLSQDKIYEVSSGIDLDELKCDCYLEVNGIAANAMYLAPHSSYGMKQSDIADLDKNGAGASYGWSSPFKLLVDADGADNNLLLSNLINKADCEQYGLKKDLSSVPSILMNDAMTAELSKISEGKISPEGAVWVSVIDHENTLASDIPYTVYSARADETGWFTEEIIEKKLTVSDTVKLNADLLKESEFLSSVLGDYKYFPGFLLINGGYAEEIGIFNDSYEKVLFAANGDKSTLNAILASSLRSEMRMDAVTRYELKRDHIYKTINEYSTIVCLFILLFSIYIVGYCNVLKLKLKLKSETLNIMRCLGLPKRRLTKFLVRDSLKQPIVSIAVSAGFIALFRKLLIGKYHEYCDLIEKRDSFIQLGKDDESVSAALRSLQNKYLLIEEMWVPSWVLPFAVLSIAICVISVVCALMLKKKQLISDITNDFSNREE